MKYACRVAAKQPVGQSFQNNQYCHDLKKNWHETPAIINNDQAKIKKSEENNASEDQISKISDQRYSHRGRITSK
jgi:hypothetical protein